jgi:hypothetical protein
MWATFTSNRSLVASLDGGDGTYDHRELDLKIP